MNHCVDCFQNRESVQNLYEHWEIDHSPLNKFFCVCCGVTMKISSKKKHVDGSKTHTSKLTTFLEITANGGFNLSNLTSLSSNTAELNTMITEQTIDGYDLQNSKLL